jgi:Bacterial regulatory proteins, gntR family
MRSAALKQAIREGVLPPGYQGSEQEIADKLKMSRTPVHEAIIRLQSEGLVKVLPKRGVPVCVVSPDDMREIYEVIIACESTAAELLAALPESERRVKADALDALNASPWELRYREKISSLGPTQTMSFIVCLLPVAATAALRALPKRLWISRIGREWSRSSGGRCQPRPSRSIKRSLMPLEKALQFRRATGRALIGHAPGICSYRCSSASA